MSEGWVKIESDDYIGRMRSQLRPGGTSDIVRLHFCRGDLWLPSEFVSKAIDELEKMPLRAELGHPPTNLEKIAYMVLLDSAYIDPRHEAEQENRLKGEK